MPVTLYHYTSAAGLLGIVSTRRIWASNAAFLYDSQELQLARFATRDRLLARADSVDPDRFPIGGGPNEEVLRASVLRVAASYLETPAADSEFQTYVACFCARGDVLSQWRAYGSDRGYAIGLSAQALSAIKRPAGAKREDWPLDVTDSLRPVIYGEEAALPALDDLTETVAEPAAGFPGMTGHTRFAVHVLPTIATIKHPTFAEEDEWRLIMVGMRHMPGTKFRASSLGIAPYVECAFDADAIREIVVGPGEYTDLRMSGARELTAAYGVPDVRISGSESPLRI